MSELDIGIMTHFGYNVSNKEDMFNSDLFLKYRIKFEEQKKMFLHKDNEGSAGKCPSCGSENTFLIEKQKRSADEAKDFDIHCGNCQSSWKAR